MHSGVHPTPSRTIIPLLLLFMVCFPASATFGAESVSGIYDVTGWNPDVEQTPENAYTGAVTIQEQNGTLTFEGTIDDIVFFGVGIHDPSSGAMAFAWTDGEDQDHGLTLVTQGQKGLEARWTDGSESVGFEHWQKRHAQE